MRIKKTCQVFLAGPQDGRLRARGCPLRQALSERQKTALEEAARADAAAVVVLVVAAVGALKHAVEAQPARSRELRADAAAHPRAAQVDRHVAGHALSRRGGCIGIPKEVVVHRGVQVEGRCAVGHVGARTNAKASNQRLEYFPLLLPQASCGLLFDSCLLQRAIYPACKTDRSS